MLCVCWCEGAFEERIWPLRRRTHTWLWHTWSPSSVLSWGGPPTHLGFQLCLPCLSKRKGPVCPAVPVSLPLGLSGPSLLSPTVCTHQDHSQPSLNRHACTLTTPRGQHRFWGCSEPESLLTPAPEEVTNLGQAPLGSYQPAQSQGALGTPQATVQRASWAAPAQLSRPALKQMEVGGQSRRGAPTGLEGASAS